MVAERAVAKGMVTNQEIPMFRIRLKSEIKDGSTEWFCSYTY